jgi:hypothetical protein
MSKMKLQRLIRETEGSLHRCEKTRDDAIKRIADKEAELVRLRALWDDTYGNNAAFPPQGKP